METKELRLILQKLKNGETSVDDAVERLRHLPFEDIGCATIDHHRTIRQGFPEVVFGEGKSLPDPADRRGLMAKGNNILVTRLSNDKADRLVTSSAACDVDACTLTIEQKPVEITGKGKFSSSLPAHPTSRWLPRRWLQHG
jgi:NCAIR mutase (PurE)-related protein